MPAVLPDGVPAQSEYCFFNPRISRKGADIPKAEPGWENKTVTDGKVNLIHLPICLQRLIGVTQRNPRSISTELFWQAVGGVLVTPLLFTCTELRASAQPISMNAFKERVSASDHSDGVVR